VKKAKNRFLRRFSANLGFFVFRWLTKHLVVSKLLELRLITGLINAHFVKKGLKRSFFLKKL